MPPTWVSSFGSAKSFGSRRIAFLLGTLVVFLGPIFPLTAQKISTNYDSKADFTALKTYSWVKGTPAPDPNVDLYIKGAADELLKEKQMRQVEPSEADVLITYHAAGDTDLAISGFHDPTHVATGGTALPGETVWSGPSTVGTSARLVRKRSLSFQMLNRATQEIVWTGTAKLTLKEKRAEQLDQLDRALTKIFDQFPPTPRRALP